jgi:hypothetical protein
MKGRSQGRPFFYDFSQLSAQRRLAGQMKADSNMPATLSRFSTNGNCNHEGVG